MGLKYFMNFNTLRTDFSLSTKVMTNSITAENILDSNRLPKIECWIHKFLCTRARKSIHNCVKTIRWKFLGKLTADRSKILILPYSKSIR